jgi:hypothetical protein
LNWYLLTPDARQSLRSDEKLERERERDGEGLCGAPRWTRGFKGGGMGGLMRDSPGINSLRPGEGIRGKKSTSALEMMSGWACDVSLRGTGCLTDMAEFPAQRRPSSSSNSSPPATLGKEVLPPFLNSGNVMYLKTEVIEMFYEYCYNILQPVQDRNVLWTCAVKNISNFILTIL